ncbi:MAG: NUDIX domain-containing protein [Tepidisphaeraceae bacterium]
MNVRHDMVTVFVARADASGASHEFLQLRRDEQDSMGGTWQFIRGAVETGESYVQAALREIQEECGLTPAEFYRVGSVESFYTSVDDTLWHSVVFCALVARDACVRLNHEHSEFRWTHRNEIKRASIWASERRILKDVLCEILDSGPAKTYLRIDLQRGS